MIFEQPRQAYIAAKAPRAGQVKTRLADALGDAAALDLYRAFLSDLADEFPATGWFVTPTDAWRDIAAIVARPVQSPASVLDQGPGDWTNRQRFLFETSAQRVCGRPPVGDRHTVAAQPFECLHRQRLLGPEEPAPVVIDRVRQPMEDPGGG